MGRPNPSTTLTSIICYIACLRVKKFTPSDPTRQNCRVALRRAFATERYETHSNYRYCNEQRCSLFIILPAHATCMMLTVDCMFSRNNILTARSLCNARAFGALCSRHTTPPPPLLLLLLLRHCCYNVIATSLTSGYDCSTDVVSWLIV